MRSGLFRSRCGRWAYNFELDALDGNELIEPCNKLRSHGIELSAPVGVGNLDEQGLLLAALFKTQDTSFLRDGTPGSKVPSGLGQLLRRQALDGLRHDALQCVGNAFHRSIITESRAGDDCALEAGKVAFSKSHGLIAVRQRAFQLTVFNGGKNLGEARPRPVPSGDEIVTIDEGRGTRGPGGQRR